MFSELTLKEQNLFQLVSKRCSKRVRLARQKIPSLPLLLFTPEIICHDIILIILLPHCRNGICHCTPNVTFIHTAPPRRMKYCQFPENVTSHLQLAEKSSFPGKLAVFQSSQWCSMDKGTIWSTVAYPIPALRYVFRPISPPRLHSVLM